MRSWLIILGVGLNIVMMVAALWAWQNAPRLTIDWARPDVATYGLRCAAVSLVAMAQVVLIGFVVRRVYRPATVDTVAGLTAGAVGVVAGVSAVALTIVGR